jgi:hypothetical protein
MISNRDFNGKAFGGLQVLQRNYNALCCENSVTYFNLLDYYKISILSKRINLLFGRYYALSQENEQKILELCENMDIVWLDTSQYGKLTKSIKQRYPSKKIITFFHNCEYDYVKQECPYNLIRQYVTKKNESWACKYSDKIIILNERDKIMIQKLYGRIADAVIPISFPNRKINFFKEKIPDIPTALFLGSNFYANIHGLKWFIEKVLPFVNIKLKIIGKDMEKANFSKNDKLEIIGYVDNLDINIQNADFMIFPIFIGGGMKVKTCEALMHGKNIIGTSEAFMGYNVDFEKVGACCETAEEFIAAINEFPKKFNSKFNQYSRNLFLEKYSDEVVFEQFADVLRKLEEQK